MLGGRKLLLKRFKTYIFKNMLKLFDNIAKNWFTMLSPDNHIKTLSTNQKMRSSSGTRMIYSPQAISFWY